MKRPEVKGVSKVANSGMARQPHRRAENPNTEALVDHEAISIDGTLKFREAYQDPFPAVDSSLQSDLCHALDLARAIHLAISLIRGVDSKVLVAFLDDTIWHSDLSGKALSISRHQVGLYDPVVGILTRLCETDTL